MVEQLTLNQWVLGSSPTGGARKARKRYVYGLLDLLGGMYGCCENGDLWKLSQQKYLVFQILLTEKHQYNIFTLLFWLYCT